MNHFFLSPSSAYRWLECPQSVNAPVVSGSSSPAAAWGTAVHESAAQCLAGDGAPLIGSAIPIEGFGDIPVDADFTDCVSAYVDYVKAQKGKLLTEIQLDLSTIFPEMSGTADALLLDKDHLHIIDLKTGRGKRVEIGTVEKPNSQLALYGLGGLNLCNLIDHPIEQVFRSITLPPHCSGPVRPSTEVPCAPTEANIPPRKDKVIPGSEYHECRGFQKCVGSAKQKRCSTGKVNTPVVVYRPFRLQYTGDFSTVVINIMPDHILHFFLHEPFSV